MTDILALCATLCTVAFIFFIYMNQGFGFSAGYLSCNRIRFKNFRDIMS